MEPDPEELYGPADGVGLGGGDVIVLCTYCPRPAARTCSGCGMPMCDAHVAPEAPMFCIQCARGHSHRSLPLMPEGSLEQRVARDLDKIQK